MTDDRPSHNPNRFTHFPAVTYEDLGNMWTAELMLDDGTGFAAVSGSTQAEAGKKALEQYIRSLSNPPQETD